MAGIYHRCRNDRLYDGILGINRDEVIQRFITSLPQRHVVPDDGRGVLSGVIIDLDKEGKTIQIKTVNK